MARLPALKGGTYVLLIRDKSVEPRRYDRYQGFLRSHAFDPRRLAMLAPCRASRERLEHNRLAIGAHT